MPNGFLVLLDNAPRRVFAFLSVTCLAMLAFGLYLQHSQGLEPCPMCIVQRYALFSVAIIAGLLSASKSKRVHFWCSFVLLLAAGFGAFVVSRLSDDVFTSGPLPCFGSACGTTGSVVSAFFSLAFSFS